MNKDPEKKYVYSLRSCAHYGPDFYRALGYEVETFRKGGVMPTGADPAREEGKEIERQGHVLMSMPLAEYEAMEQEALDVERARRDMIIKSPTGYDPMRGIHRGITPLRNETSELERLG